jgi:phosphoserine phosphatase
MADPPRALVVFDLDGTLLRGPTACELIALSLGRERRMSEMERLTAPGDIAAARREMASWYLGAESARLLAALDAARVAPGAAEGIERLRTNGVEVGIASMTWRFAVDRFASIWRVEHRLGTTLAPDGTIGNVWPADKARWLRELAGRFRLARARTAAVGDSSGDHEMLAAAGIPIHVGPTPPPVSVGFRHRPDADIDEIARLLLDGWRT